MVVLLFPLFPATSLAVAVTLVVPCAAMVHGLLPQERERLATPLAESAALAERVTAERYHPPPPAIPVGLKVIDGGTVSLRTVRFVLPVFPATSLAVAVIVVVPSAVTVQGLLPQDRERDARPETVSLPLPVTVTLLRYHPPPPSVPDGERETEGEPVSTLNDRLWALDWSP
jgi:hypothetical protein